MPSTNNFQMINNQLKLIMIKHLNKLQKFGYLNLHAIFSTYRLYTFKVVAGTLYFCILRRYRWLVYKFMTYR